MNFLVEDSKIIKSMLEEDETVEDVIKNLDKIVNI